MNNHKQLGMLLAFAAVSAALCLGLVKTEEEADLSLLTLDRIFVQREFETERFGPVRWLEKGYPTLEPVDKAGQDIAYYDAATGSRTVWVAADQLVPDWQKNPLEISAYDLTEDRTKVLIFTNTQRVWRLHTRGDYWVLDRKIGTLRQLGSNAKPSTLMFAKFSPDGGRVAYVRENNIYVENLASGQVLKLTHDGSDTVINGTSDWVYEEEFGIRDGFRWSPDGKWIAYWQFDSHGVGDFRLINNTDSLYPEIITFKHPKVGTTNSACRIGVVDVGGGETLWFQLPGDARNHYIARMGWSGPDEVFLQRLNRLQNTEWMILGNVLTGEVRTILNERDEAWVDAEEARWIDEGSSFLWLSERDGWNHLYRIHRADRNVRLLTPGSFDVISQEAVDEEDGWVYFTASPDNPTQRFLFRARLDGSGAVERVTPEGEGGSHGYQISPDGRWAIHTASSFGTPPITTLVELPEHREVRVLAGNTELKNKVDALKKGPAEFFRVNIGEAALDGWMMKPPGFDPSKKYPLLFYIYGEPAGSTVRDSWEGRNYLWHLMLTQKGYLVASLDNRGTRVPKGRAWRKSIYRQVGILAAEDQAAALKRMLEERSYIDPERIGIWGWSGGGQMSLNMIFCYPELYSTAMAIAFVSDQRLYDTIYQERYMGLPEDNEEGYREGSPITHAHKLEGNLLIVHGTGDDNVHYQSFERLVNELIRHNKHFTMMSYPNRSHSISEGENTSRHLFELLTRYLESHMPPGAR
jgi:dipeptidyl-peptidase-4